MSVSIHRAFIDRTMSPYEATVPGPSGGAERLRWLVRRIAADDHAAFAELFHRVAVPVSTRLSGRVSDPARVSGILAGTFVEVWWLAGGYVDADTDVMAWIDTIVERRLADSRPPVAAADPDAPSPITLTEIWAQRVEAELVRLLSRHPAPVIPFELSTSQ